MTCARGSKRRNRRILFCGHSIGTERVRKRRRTHGKGVEHGCTETAIKARDALLLKDALEQRSHGASVGRVGLYPGLYAAR
jgi:hypothetical protein